MRVLDNNDPWTKMQVATHENGARCTIIDTDEVARQVNEREDGTARLYQSIVCDVWVHRTSAPRTHVLIRTFEPGEKEEHCPVFWWGWSDAIGEDQFAAATIGLVLKGQKIGRHCARNGLPTFAQFINWNPTWGLIGAKGW